MAVLKCNINNKIKNIDLRQTNIVEFENLTIERIPNVDATTEYIRLISVKNNFKIELFISAHINESIADISKLNLDNLAQTPLKVLLDKYKVTHILLGGTLHTQYDTIELFFDRTSNEEEEFNNSKNTSALIKTYKLDEFMSYDINLTLEQMYKSEITHQFITKVFRNKYAVMEIATNNLGKITDASIVSIVKPGKQVELEDNICGLSIKHSITFEKQKKKEPLKRLQSTKVNFKLNEIACKRQHLKYSNIKTKKETIKNINKYEDLAIKSALERMQ